MKKIIVAVGPGAKPITGQSMCFSTILENSVNTMVPIRHPSRGDGAVRALTSMMAGWWSLFCSRIIRRSTHLYISSSRTTVGFIRDSSYILIAKAMGMDVVNHLHGADFRAFRSQSYPILVWVIDFVYSKIDSHIVLTSNMKSEYELYSRSKVVVIPNFAPKNNMETLPPKIDQAFRVLFLSNIIWSKGVIDAMTAVKALAEELKLEFHIAGDFLGDANKSAFEIEEAFWREFDSDFMTYHGVVTGAEKVELLQTCELFLFPTFYPTEAQPLAVLEAMAFGLVIVSTNHNYMPDFLLPEFSILVGPNDVDELIAAVRRVALDKSLRVSMGHAAYNESQKYSIETHIEAVDGVFS